MTIFGNFGKPSVPPRSDTPAQPAAPPKRTRRTSGRTQVYSVRVRDGFKADILCLQAELQIEQSRMPGPARKIAEGEVIELVLQAFKASRASSPALAGAMTLSNEVIEGIRAIADAERITPAEALERLVVQKFAQLGLAPQRQI